MYSPAMCVFVAGLCAGNALSQARPVNRMEITLERNGVSGWTPVHPGFVLSSNDRVRFRFRSNFPGYLYVMNQGTSGDYALLFPREDTGSQNRIEAGKEYVIPATEGHFRVTGPAGHDIVYWLVTPADLGGESSSPLTHVPLPAAPKDPEARKSLTPRCDETLLRARGDCIDGSAGAKGVAASGELPENLRAVPGVSGSRELIFMRSDRSSIVSSPVPLQGPVVYEFRLAHR
ncbi:MAG: DUF4384 domain-containing protein [Bryobacteraceae bacterium]|nr:DUF4384 domain-containing protein [Bryobacteraceae bacterium]